MNERQRRFADEYIITGNAYRAAINAGYSEKYAKTNSHKLLENTRIKEYIDRQLEKIESEKIAEASEVLEFLTSVMRDEKTQEEVYVVGNGEGIGRIERVDVRVPARERIKAAELLGKRYGLWSEKVDLSVTVPQFIDDMEDG